MPEIMTRRNAAFANSFNAETMTIDAVVSTFADVTRRDAKGVYVERLDPAGLDMSDPMRGIPSIPVLDSHRQGSARDIIGVVTSFRAEDDKVLATIRLSLAEDAQPVIARIREGTLTGVSIGYAVDEWRETKETGKRIRTAIRWRIVEVSAVPVPADSGATFRSGDNSMPTENENQNPADNDNVRVETRAEIRTIARSAGLTPEWADQCIDGDMTIVEVRAAAFEQMQTRTRNTPRIRVVGQSGDDPEVIRRHREDALFARINGGAPEEHARQYMGDTLRDHARAILEAHGVSTRGMDVDTLFRTAMHTTSDFTNLLTGVGSRTLRPAYEAAQSPLKSVLARQSTRTDFRTGTALRLGELGLLQKVSESGEIKSTTRAEAAESYAIDTYASMFTISRKALINDDLGAFRDWGTAAGQAAAQTEAALLFSLLTQSSGAGPTMGEDGKRLFHTDHGNLSATGNFIHPDSLTVARLALRNMTGLDKKTFVNVKPKYLLCGPAMETAAERVLSDIAATHYEGVNPFSGKLELLIEPRITDYSWFVFADPATMPTLEYSYLASAQGPQMASREGFEVLATEFRVHLDFGCGAVDWRGAYRNPGSAERTD